MPHASHIITCTGPADPHALDGISQQPRMGKLDSACPLCLGHGQWNREYDLVSQRSKRTLCHQCDGRGWIETGDDPVPSHDVALSPEGYPDWVVRFDPPQGSD
jgi:hypothetical protein